MKIIHSNYLEWLIGYSLNIRKFICEFNEEEIENFKKGMVGMLNQEMTLNLEIIQPDVLSIC